MVATCSKSLLPGEVMTFSDSLAPATGTSVSPRIMAIDDTPENLNLLMNMLGDNGFEVLALPSGPLALSAAERMPPDLVLLDITMPGMDGYEVCERFKRHPQLRHIP